MFKKYPSLTQDYSQKSINRWKNIFPDYLKCSWVLTEKIDGANVSLLITPNHLPRWFSRNREITNEDFYGCSELLSEVCVKLTPLFDYVKTTNNNVRIFGELFGPKIQDRIDYGSQKRVLFYDMMVNDRFVPQMMFENFMYDIGLGRFVAPKLGIVGTLDEALNNDPVFDSLVGGIENNKAEGFVIKPWEKIFVDENGSVFYVKCKNPKFAEKEGRKRIKQRKEWSEETIKWKEEFIRYINDNRVKSVFSKEGVIETPKDIGKYIKLVMQDALEDFHNDHPEFEKSNLTKEEKKYALNVSSMVPKLLQVYL